MQGIKRRDETTKHIKKSRSSCRVLCCSCRLSVSSTDHEAADHHSSERHPSISYLAHAMVQERLDQMIKEGQEEEALRQQADAARRRKQKKKMTVSSAASSSSRSGKNNGNSNSSSTEYKKNRFILMIAVEKRSCDPRDDFRKSMVEMIMSKGIQEPKDLRYLLNCYVSMNSEEYTRIILEAFYEVCSKLFLCCRCHYPYINE